MSSCISDLNATWSGGVLYLIARGGTRRQRAAAMVAYLRKHPGLTRVARTYSETHGFLSATYATYREAK